MAESTIGSIARETVTSGTKYMVERFGECMQNKRGHFQHLLRTLVYVSSEQNIHWIVSNLYGDVRLHFDWRLDLRRIVHSMSTIFQFLLLLFTLHISLALYSHSSLILSVHFPVILMCDRLCDLVVRVLGHRSSGYIVHSCPLASN
jgi:hypothetical protein